MLFEIIGYGLSALVSSVVNGWSSHKNRKSPESISQLNRSSSQDIAQLSKEHSAELQYQQMKFAVLQQRDDQQFQRELAELSHERIKEIEAYRAQVNGAINQENLDFQKWRLQQEKIIQLDLLQIQQNFQRELTNIQNQNALIQMRERMRADKSPINNLACDLLENSFAHGIMPLKVFLAPPILDYDSSTGKPYNDGYESFLAKEIEQFLHQGYLNSKQYPVQLLDGSWISKKQGGGSALQSIHAQLKSIPVLVLESKIPLGELHFGLGYWNSGDTSYIQSSILSGISFSELLYSSAKQRALEWEVTRQKLELLKKDEAYIKTMGGVNEENLQIYYRELAEKRELEQHGIDTSNVPKQYKITIGDYKIFYQYLAVWHCLAIGLYADMLFLGNSWENPPLLPSLIPYLLEKYQNHFLLTPKFWQETIAKIVTTYGQFYDSLKSDAAHCLPGEIRMQLALSLANLPSEYKYLAFKQCEAAVTDWLQANTGASDKVFDLDNDEDCQLLKRIFYQEDKPFLDSVKQLLAIVKDGENIDLSTWNRINSLLEGWKLFSRFGNIPYLPQVEVESEPEEKDETFSIGNGVTMDFVAIPAGSFLMGGQAQIHIESFLMGKYPVTQEQWEAVMGDNPSHFKGSKRPVESVSWDMAQEFCQKLSGKTGQKFRLPSEAEWEYACRGGTTTEYFFGNNASDLDNYAWFKDNSNQETHPVGEKEPNPWGLYDIIGNVFEWCEDDWVDNLNSVPRNGKPVTNNNNQTNVERGGAHDRPATTCASAYRYGDARDRRYEYYGFRIALAFASIS
ncbi:MAG: formylglycine-generating enzyme family protein [Gomphosphaeria aponina SAG 52.96 = DSM 107014]|uniref:Formylglycine-generating enzyme family protein n=1 Tax=Gomphosphaeria aponina SAG 52.96 = DSM 107014 TaxID=1521640 RepID=A0A941GT22_9CHRO|nr:formylglycine-generating enzyme family protein [Gomphosphaeria aponina SAG 52.96 = DSM 107014]